MQVANDAALRVAIIAPPYYAIPPTSYGGIERVCYLLAEGLVKRGHDVTLVAAGAANTRARSIRTLDAPREEGTDEDVLTEVVHAARAMVALDDLNVDLVHDHTIVGPLTGRHRSAPTVVTAHMPVAGPESRLELFEALNPWCRLVALSEAQRHSAPHLNWVGTVHNGVQVEDYPLRRWKEDFILCLGRISCTKGVHLAIEAAKTAGRRLVIAGRPTIASERDYFESEVVPRLGQGVEWVGEVAGAEKAELLGRARCLLAPLQWEEPFGLVLLEAMACGTPVVALRAGSVPELVINGVTGLVCDHPSDLPRAVEAVSALDTQVCHDWVAQNFTANKMVLGYEAVYRQVLSDDKAGRRNR